MSIEQSSLPVIERALRAARERDYWVPACGGTETPFRTRTGRTLHYLWNPITGQHCYYDVGADLFLTQHEAEVALDLFGNGASPALSS